MKPVSIEKEHQFLTRTISSLSDQIDLFATFQDLSLKIISQFDLENILETFCNILKELMNYQSVSTYLFVEGEILYKRVHHSGDTSRRQRGIIPDPKILKWVMSQGRWTVLTDFQDENAGYLLSVLPLKAPNQLLGFVIITTEVSPSLYNQKLSSILNFLGSQTAIAIENQELYSRTNHSNAYMTNMLESISNGIMATDMEGRITLINKNATAITGINSKQIIGKHYYNFLKNDLGKEIKQLCSTIKNKGFAIESMVNHSPYKEVDIIIGISASPLTDNTENTIGIIYVFRDLSASKEIERLTKLDEIKSELVSNVSHELRTPLSIIKSYSEALINQVEPEDHKTREKFLSVIGDETDRLSNIVSNLLDISRIESGKFTLYFNKTKLEDIVNSVISVFKTKSANINIFTDFQKNLPPIEADEDKIREVLINLVANSIKFSPMGGTINIAVVTQDDLICCSVSDTGIGIPKDQLDRIFEKFYRVDNSDTYEIEGTGLGLSIVKHIMDAHQGGITVDSIMGKGSVFSIYLPITRG